MRFFLVKAELYYIFLLEFSVAGSPTPRQSHTTDIKSFEIIPKKPRTQLNRLKSLNPRPQTTQFRSQVNRDSSKFSNGAVRSTNRGAARFITTPNRQTNSLSKDFVTKKLSVNKVKAIKLPRQRVSLPAVNNNPENFMVFNNKELVLPNPRPRVNINIQRPLEINTARNININRPVNKPNPIQNSPAPVINFPTQPQTIPFSSVQPQPEQEAFEPRVLPQPILPQPVDLSISSESFQLEGDNGERDDIINVFDLSNIDLNRLPASTDNFAPSAPAIFEPIPAVPNLVLPPVSVLEPGALRVAIPIQDEIIPDVSGQEDDGVNISTLLDGAFPAVPGLPVNSSPTFQEPVLTEDESLNELVPNMVLAAVPAVPTTQSV